jgi:hypothetical protein
MSDVPSSAAATASSGPRPFEQRVQRVRRPEQHLALVGEVAEEGPLGEPRALGDVGHGRLVEAALAVQLHGGLLEPLARVGFPSGHETTLRQLLTSRH